MRGHERGYGEEEQHMVTVLTRAASWRGSEALPWHEHKRDNHLRLISPAVSLLYMSLFLGVVLAEAPEVH